MNRHHFASRQYLRIAAALALALMLVHGAAWAGSTASCGTSIAACGCTITTPGLYTVTANLSYTQGLTVAGDCIAISANKVTLNVNDYSIEGPGAGTSTGAGIDVLMTPSGAFIEGAGGEVYGWKYGLHVQGTNAASDYLYPWGNLVGVFIDGATGANINDFETGDNWVYGVWIRNGQGNQVNAFSTSYNGGTGVYIGCQDDDTRGTRCPGGTSSSGNRIYDCGSEYNSDAGVVIDVGNGQNVITDCSVEFNYGGVDSIDENSHCGSDTWFYGDFGVTNQSCIP